MDLKRRIKIQWRTATRAESKDPDTGQRLAILLKSPRAFAKSTRGPSLFKNNYSWTLILTNNPLSFFKIGPAVQVSSFTR